MSVIALGYIVAQTRNLDAWSEFATAVVGLMPADSPRDDVRLFRMDDRPFRFWIEEGPSNSFICAGWELRSKADFEATLERLRKAGCTVEIATAEEARARAVYELARSSDPAGNAMELFYGRFNDYAPFTSPAAVSHFVTGPNGERKKGRP